MAVIENKILIKIEVSDIINGEYFVPEGVTAIGKSVFKGQASLRKVHIPNSLTSIGENAFYECYHLEDINIPNSVTKIEAKAFFNCKKLKNLKLPKGLLSIGKYAFCYCNSLTSTIIPEGVILVEYSAFSACKNLTSVIFPNSVTFLGKSVFNGCKSLIKVKLPDNIDQIDINTFLNCPCLEEIKYKKNIIKISNLVKFHVKNNVLIVIDHYTVNIVRSTGELIKLEGNDADIYKKIHNQMLPSELNYCELYDKIKTLKCKGLSKPSFAFTKLSIEQIEKINTKFYFNLVKLVGIDDVTRSAILEMLFTLGAFESDNGVNERRNYIKKLLIIPPSKIELKKYHDFWQTVSRTGSDAGIKLLNKAYRRKEDCYQLVALEEKDINQLVPLIRDYSGLMLDNNKLHDVFDGMDLNLGFDERFYIFFKKNYDKIISTTEDCKNLVNIQRKFDYYFRVLGQNSNVLTLEAIKQFQKKLPYLNIRDGCLRLAQEAKAINGGLGLSQESFNWYQNEAYPKMIARTESSIPNLKVTLENGINGEFLRLDDIDNLLAGEKTNCCQVYNRFGDSSMMHACFSKNARIFLVKNKDGEILGQSWTWLNNNTLCFDNFEATSFYKNSVNPENGFKSSFNKYKDSVKELYELAGNQVIRASQEKINELMAINPNCDYLTEQILTVTLGIGRDDSGFIKGMEPINHPSYPPKDLDFFPYTDSEEQILLAGKQIEEKRGYPKKHLYRDEHQLIEFFSEKNDKKFVYKSNSF